MDDKAARAAQSLANRFLETHPDETAKRLESVPVAEIVRILSTATSNAATAVLERMVPATAARVIEEMAAPEIYPIVSGMDPSIAASLLSRLDEESRNRLLDLLAKSQADELRSLMTYPPDSAGCLMDPRVMTFRPGTTVEEALKTLRQGRKQRIYDVFVARPDGSLVGSVPLQDIAVSPPDKKLMDLVRPSPSVLSTESREEISELLETYKLTSLAVVNMDNRLLGVIRHETLLAAAQAEATLDVQTMVGVSRQERALSKVSFAVRKRLPWLNINLATAFLAAGVVGIFEDTIARFTALAVLLPVVAGQSGNTGSQALAVTMRGLALREVRARHWLRVARKEVSVALFNGIAIALVTASAVYFWSGSAGLSMVIGSSMILSMVAAGFAGALIPMLLTSLGQDPAQSSSIILTTVTDVAGFLSFLGLATLLSAML
jgi:magnesium transporter